MERFIIGDFEGKDKFFPRQEYDFRQNLRYFAVMKHAKPLLLILMMLVPFLHGCKDIPQNPNRPILPYPITIDLRDSQYYQLYFVSGWLYITSDLESTSRGIIVYRQSDTEFLAYDRMPPNDPDACTDSHGNTTRLVVDFPFVVDNCNNAYYNILNGQIIVAEPDKIPNFPTDGTVVYPLIQYHVTFDGSKLVITN